jgi:hypothetical protein
VGKMVGNKAGNMVGRTDYKQYNQLHFPMVLRKK